MYKKTILIICAALFFGLSHATPLSKNDLGRITSQLNSCSVTGLFDKFDAELFIRLFGQEYVKNGVPKTNSMMQDQFYKLALESYTIPNAKDKATILKIFFDETCSGIDFQYESAIIRKFLADRQISRVNLRSEVTNDKLTYAQIAQKFSTDNETELNKAMAESLEIHTDLRDELVRGVIPLVQKIIQLFKKYEVSFQ